VLFDQSKNNRNHDKLKVDFHGRVILPTSMAVNLTGFSCVMACVLRKLRVGPHSTFSLDVSRLYILSIYFLFCFVLNAVKVTSIETDEMLVSQSKHKPERHYKMLRLDLKFPVKM